MAVCDEAVTSIRKPYSVLSLRFTDRVRSCLVSICYRSVTHCKYLGRRVNFPTKAAPVRTVLKEGVLLMVGTASLISLPMC
jgi:hypothetical protein